MLKNGQEAPSFTLMADDGAEHTLAQYSGKPLVALFFRGKFCPTSKRYLIEWQEFSRKVQNLGGAFVAISHDSVDTQAWMKNQYGLRIPLLSDKGVEVAKSYGAYVDYKEGEGEYSEPALVILYKDQKVAYSVISSGPKGFPGPGEIAAILIYMFVHEGTY
jgi:peroxiredoxin